MGLSIPSQDLYKAFLGCRAFCSACLGVYCCGVIYYLWSVVLHGRLPDGGKGEHN